MEDREESRMRDGTVRLLLGITGSVAAIKAELLVQQIQSAAADKGLEAEIKVVATEKGLFFMRDRFTACAKTDTDEWHCWGERGDPVLHVELRRWADVFLIAPLSANSLAKIACGICDNLLTSVARAWDYSSKPLIVAPAMNTLMWHHPLTERQLNELKGFGGIVIPPIEKELMCGDTGLGAMAEPSDIAVEAIAAFIRSSERLAQQQHQQQQQQEQQKQKQR